jgi:hypothetical protein
MSKRQSKPTTSGNSDNASPSNTRPVRRSAASILNVRKRTRPARPVPRSITASGQTVSQTNSKPVPTGTSDVARRAKNQEQQPDNNNDQRSQSKGGQNQDYDVGYKKPPKKHQYKPGQTGNPKGRPKGAKNTKTIVDELLSKKLEIKMDGKTKKISAREAALLAVLQKALKGDSRAFKQILDLDPRNNNEIEAGNPQEQPLNDIEQDIINQFIEQRMGGDDENET